MLRDHIYRGRQVWSAVRMKRGTEAKMENQAHFFPVGGNAGLNELVTGNTGSGIFVVAADWDACV